MSSKEELALQTACNRLYRMFAKDFEVAKYNPDKVSEDSSGFGPMGNVADNYDNWQTCHNLIYPIGTSGSSLLGNQIKMLTGSTAETFAYEIISKDNYPLKSKIKYHDQIMKISKKADYSDTVGFFVYFVNDRSDDNV